MDPDIPLPVLRPDLDFFPGPAAPDGSPTYTMYDPVMRTYDKVSWAAMAILERLRSPGTLDALLKDVAGSTTLRLIGKDVMDFCAVLVRQGLTRDMPVRAVQVLNTVADSRRVRVWKWLIHNYLYFRIPLLKPDAFLSRTLPLVRPLGRPLALAAFALLSILGLTTLSFRLEEYAATFPYFFNWQGLFWYAVAIATLKIVHEFSHAYAAKRHGLRVPVMGVAFMVLWPVAYCDVTDAWRLSQRDHRLSIALAGVTAECVLAGLSLLAWGLSPPGIVKSIFFVLSSGSLLSTLLINLNPAMSFDGYYILMDIMGIDNLRSRAFALTRWLIRKNLFGMGAPSPEPNIRTGRLWAMLLYSVYSWVYRLFLYLSIAILVYYKFTKILGFVLFSVEIGFFIFLPVIQEAREVFRNRQYLTNKRSLFIFCGFLMLLVFWIMLPIQRTFHAPSAVSSESSQIVYAPTPGDITDIYVSRGDSIIQGQALMRLSSEDLTEKLSVLGHEKIILEKQITQFAQSDEQKVFLPQKRNEIKSLEAQLAGLSRQREQLTIVAEVTGILCDWDDTLKSGRYVSKNEIFGRIMDTRKLKVEAFVAENDIATLAIGDTASYLPDTGAPSVSGTVRKISPVRSEKMEYAPLTSQGKGELPVVQDRSGRLVMLETYYAVEIGFESPPENMFIGQTGKTRLKTRPRSAGLDWARHAYRVFLRESNF